MIEKINGFREVLTGTRRIIESAGIYLAYIMKRVGGEPELD